MASHGNPCLSLVLICVKLLSLAKGSHLRSTCDQGDTEWNRKFVSRHLKHWICTIKLKDNKAPSDFIVKFKELSQLPNACALLDLIVKLEKSTNVSSHPEVRTFY